MCHMKLNCKTAKFLIKTQGKNRTSNMSGIGADLVHGI